MPFSGRQRAQRLKLKRGNHAAQNGPGTNKRITRCLLEMQSLGPSSRPPESEFSYLEYPQVIYVLIKFEKH